LNLLKYVGGLIFSRKLCGFICPFILGIGDNVHIVGIIFLFLAVQVGGKVIKGKFAIY
jgi:hypothetical protein